MTGAIAASGFWIALAVYIGLNKIADAIKGAKPWTKYHQR